MKFGDIDESRNPLRCFRATPSPSAMPLNTCTNPISAHLLRYLALSCGIHVATYFLLAHAVELVDLPAGVSPPARPTALLATLTGRRAGDDAPVAAGNTTTPQPEGLPPPEFTAGPRLQNFFGTSGDSSQNFIADLVNEIVAKLDLHYYPSSRLTQRPRPLQEIVPTVPAEKNIIRSGTVILRLFLNETGEVDKVVVESSVLPESYQKAAAAAFEKARFAPGEINGAPVRSQMRIEVVFEPPLEILLGRPKSILN